MNSSEGSHTIKRDLGTLGSLKNRNDINLLNLKHEDSDRMERGMKKCLLAGALTKDVSLASCV